MGRARKRRPGPKRASIITCPICDGLAQLAYVPKEIADMLMITAGNKYVCTNKFIYRTRNDQLQFSDCYGLPVEFTLKMDQNGCSKQDSLDIATKFSEKYMEGIMSIDKFFKSVQAFFYAVPKEVEVSAVKPDEMDDPKQFMKDEDEKHD